MLLYHHIRTVGIVQDWTGHKTQIPIEYHRSCNT